MGYLSRRLFIVNAVIMTILLSSTTETTITTIPGDNRTIKWTLDPVPKSNVIVRVLHPSGATLFRALGTNVPHEATDLGNRVSNTGNTNTFTGHIEFTLSDVTVEDAGEYRTQYELLVGGVLATNTGVTLVVHVYGAPDQPVLSINSNTADFREHSPIIFQCTTQSVLPSTMTIYRGNMTALAAENNAISITHTIPQATCLDTGYFYCSAENSNGKTTSEGQYVNVLCAPDQPVLSINSNTADFRENSPIIFQCTTQSVLPSMMTIYRGNMTALAAENNAIIITHTIPQATCLDTGYFYCSAENSNGKTTSEGIYVNVLCKPRSDNKVTQEIKQALGSGETMNIAGTLISNPLPTIYWSKRLVGSTMSNNLTNNTDNFVYHNNLKTLTVSSRAVRTDMKKSDFGEYMMHAYNDYGQSTTIFTVATTDDIVVTPQSPTSDSTCSIVVALSVVGLVALLVGISILIWWNCRRTRSAKTNPKRESHYYDTIGEVPGNGGQNRETAISQSGVYEGLGDRSMPAVYEGLKHSRTRQEQCEDQYVNTRIN